MCYRLAGGAMMFVIGLYYLVLGGRTTKADAAQASSPSSGADTASSDNSLAPNQDPITRNIVAVQVGLIALSMYVTSSSVRSLQAKQGLPLGNQVVGWLTLSMLLLFLRLSINLLTVVSSSLSGCSIPPQPSPTNRPYIPATPTHDHFPHLFSDIRPPNHLV